MKNNPLATICAYMSIASIVAGFVLIIAALSPKTTSEWGAAASGLGPQAVLVAGGLIALAIYASCSPSHADKS